MKKMKIKLTLFVMILALMGACQFEYDKPAVDFIPVEAVTGIPSGGVAGYELVLARTVSPDNATNKTIVWSVINEGGTNPALYRDILKTENEGTVTLRAVIKNGKTANTDYVEDFEIKIYSEDDYTPVGIITGIPSECEIGEITLSPAVSPINAVNKTVVWEVKAAGTTGAVISGDRLTTTAVGALVITAVIAGGKKPGVDYRQDFTIYVIKPAVQSITGIPLKCYTGDIVLSGTVNPAGANNTIVWTVKDAGETGAVINGNTLTTTADGTVVITARIADGKRPGLDYTRDFIIEVLPAPDIRVYVAGYSGMVDCYWKDGVRKFLPLPRGYTQSTAFAYAKCITAADGSVYIAGSYFIISDSIYHPCYWKDGLVEFYDDNVKGGINGITVYGGDVYMSGYSGNEGNKMPCYWKNGTRVELEMPEDRVPDLNSEAIYNIVVDGSTVYVGCLYYNGSNSISFYWKITNGVQERVIYANPPSYNGSLSVGGSIAVLDGAVYAAGSYRNGTNIVAGYWKNGVYVSDLPKPEGAAHYEASTIAVAEDKLCIGGGLYYNYGGYWVWDGTGFGSFVRLADSRTTVTDITAYKKDGVLKVYVLGEDDDYKPAYWIDGIHGEELLDGYTAAGIAALWE